MTDIERLTEDLEAAYRCIADYNEKLKTGWLPGPTLEARHSLTVQAAELFVATGAIGQAEPEATAPLFESLQ